MSDKILAKLSQNRTRIPSFGADLESKGWQEIALERVENPPITFAGRQLTRHWAWVFQDAVVAVTLWQRRKSGFVVSFTALVAGVLKTDSVAVDSLAEAMTFLEDYCADPPLSARPVERLVDSILQLQRTVTYTQAFATLVGEALAVWSLHGQSPKGSCIAERVQA